MFSSQSHVRRLPIYIILDTSRSMLGKPIAAVNESLSMMRNTLIHDPFTVETAFVSIIEYNTEPRQVVPLTDITSFNAPTLQAGGWSALGAALRLLNQCLDQDILLNTDEYKGDYRPQVFLLSDGRPSDAWKMASKALRKRSTISMGSFIALGCGPKADLETLSQIADIVLSSAELSPANIVSFFKWVSQSIGVASKSATGAGGQIVLPPPPPVFQIIMRSV
jgi:uncharacterized protein YegL